ncbi:hypothetical protein BDD12DRAFT_946641, partial [Trichophaea hybrida]
MEATDPKRPRLHSWGGGESASPSEMEAALHQFQQASYSSHSQYPNMAGWGEVKPRSQSFCGGGNGGNGVPGGGGGGGGGGRSSIGKTGHHFSSYAPLDIGDSHSPVSDNPLSVNSHGISPSGSSELQGFVPFHAQPPQSSDIDPVGAANPSPPSQPMPRQQLKPLQAVKGSNFHDPTGYYQGATEHRGSISAGGTEMNSPANSNSVMLQNHQLVGTAPVNTQAVNVVTTYPPRRKAIRAAQVLNFPYSLFPLYMQWTNWNRLAMHVEPEKPNVTKGDPAVGFARNRKLPVSTAKYHHRSRNCFLAVFLQYRLDAQAYSRQDRTLLQILERLGRVETLLDNLNSRGETQIHQVDKAPNRTTTNPPTQTPPTPTLQTAAKTTPAETPLDDDEQLTIPYQHTTAAHKLLRWP